jgi:hypothetical protein
MKKLFASTILVALAVFGGANAAAQRSNRTLIWPPLPVDRITSAGDGIKLSPVNEAVQISDITVAGHSVIPGETFNADDDWLRTLTIRLKNVSGQTIVAARVGFGLPEKKAGDRQVGFSLEYGKMGLGGIVREGQAMVRPEEEFEMKFNGDQYRKYLEFFAKHAGSVNFTKAWIGITTIKFEDGTIWSSGCLRATNPRASCTPRAK